MRICYLFLLSTLLAAWTVQAQSYRTELIDNGNGFTARETFTTSTQAATGYDAYATWDAQTLFFGMTGQDVGDPACDPAESADCPIYETGQSMNKWLAYYLDTDPLDDQNGTTTAYTESGWTQSWTLPFKADYLVLIRTDGVTSQQGFYTGEATLRAWDGSAWTVVEPASGPSGASSLVIGDNNTSGYLEFSLDRAAVGSPDFLRVVSWIFNTADNPDIEGDDRRSYAYWPSTAPQTGAADSEGTTGGATTLDSYYGFVLIDEQTPAASNGQANLDRPFFAGLTAQPLNNGVPAQGGFAGRSLPFHSTGFTNSNDFSANEVFATSTPTADTGYEAYATWDDVNLSFGYTGSDVGGGDCSDLTVETCDVFELGQSPKKWIVYYLDTDPTGDSGTDQALAYGPQTWTLPFLADVLVQIRTDGVTIEGAYTGVADVKTWDGAAWVSQGPVDNLELFDNSSSGFLKYTLDLDVLGSPDQIQVVSWFLNDEDFEATDADDRVSYGYWPADAPAEGAADAQGVTSGATTLDSAYGFLLDDAQSPNASNGSSNLRRPFFGAFDCPAEFPGDPGDNPGTSLPFHSIPINGSNSFNSANELFATSTDADTGYDAYFTWDAQRLYVGVTGSDVGGGDCSDTSNPDCFSFETGQTTDKWIVYFFDTDPTGTNGTTTAYLPADTIDTNQSWTLPFAADYAVYLRTDGSSRDVFPYTGVAEVKQYDGGTWRSLGPCPLQVFDNNTSGYLEFSIDLSDIGNPLLIKTAGWIVDAGDDISYAYWPDDAPADGALTAEGTTSGAVTIDTYWGFELIDGIIPNAPGNKNREFFIDVEDQTTFSTYTVNGTRDANEQLPQEYLGRENTSSPALYLTWDADNLYLSFADNPLVDTGSDLYLTFDTDPAVGSDPQDGNGSTSQPDVGPAGSSPNQPTYPFAADVVFRIAGTASPDADVITAEGEKYTYASEAWSQEAMPSGVQIIRQQAGPTEVAVPWSAVGLSAADSSYFHLILYLNDSGNGIDAQWPPANPNAQNPGLTDFYSYYVQPGAEPGSRAYLSLRTDQGSSLNDGLYGNLYLVVPNADQNSATWGLAANTTVVNELYIGQSATLDVGSNSDNPGGNNLLRVGRQLTGVGELLARDGVVFTFDPAVGFPEDDQPEGGFATRSFTTTLACSITFNDLVLLNDTQQAACPDGGGQSAQLLGDTPLASTPTPGEDRGDDRDDKADGECPALRRAERAAVTGRLPGPDALSMLDAQSVEWKAVRAWSPEERKELAFYIECEDYLRREPAENEGSVTIGGNLNLEGGGLDTGGNKLTLGDGATVSGRASGNRIAGGITRIVMTKDPVSLTFPVGGNVALDLKLDLRHWTDWRTEYTVEEKLEPAPELWKPPSIEAVSDVRYFTVDKEGDRFFGRGAPLRRAEADVPYGPDNALGAPERFRVVRSSIFDLFYVNLGGTLTPGSDDERGAVASNPFHWFGGGELALARGSASARGEGGGREGLHAGDPDSAADKAEKLPTAFALEAAYPNPFNPQTTIRYALPEPTAVRLSVYDALGRQVAQLFDGEQAAGRHAVTFDARHLAGGTYFYRIEAGAFTQVRQVVLVK